MSFQPSARKQLSGNQMPRRLIGKGRDFAITRALSFVRLNNRLIRQLGLLWYTFIAFVCVPAFVTLAYLLIFASPEYESEARFAVRGSSENRNTAVTDALAVLSTAIGGRSSAQDSFIVADYIRSRTIIEDLGGKNIVEDIYSKPDTDWLSRLSPDKPLEDVWEYWRRKVTAIIDTQSSVLTLRVRAFAPSDAKQLADKILLRSEQLVNDISERARQDALSRAESEVGLALQKLARIRVALLEFRTGSNTIDPIGAATSLSETLTALSREKITLESNRDALQGVMDKNAPTMRHLSSQIEAVEQQIKILQEKLTSPIKDGAAISEQLAVYEDLQLQGQFAEKLFTISQAGFEKARAEQDKQQLYLMTIVRPTMPEEATYPKPFINAGIVFALCLMLWSMVALVVASIEDHIG